jgi:hypothetical protein
MCEPIIMRDPTINNMCQRNVANSRGMKRGTHVCWTTCGGTDKNQHSKPNHFLLRTITLINIYDIVYKQLTGSMERILIRAHSPVFI